MLKMDLVGRKERGRLLRSLIDVVKKDTQMDDDYVRDKMRWRQMIPCGNQKMWGSYFSLIEVILN